MKLEEDERRRLLAELAEQRRFHESELARIERMKLLLGETGGRRRPRIRAREIRLENYGY